MKGDAMATSKASNHKHAISQINPLVSIGYFLVGTVVVALVLIGGAYTAAHLNPEKYTYLIEMGTWEIVFWAVLIVILSSVLGGVFGLNVCLDKHYPCED
jgi:Na+/H+ antiporter NhaC